MAEKTENKAPAFQFYAQDFLMGTLEFTAEEVGGYIRLLCHQWDKGCIPNDDKKILQLSGMKSKSLAAVKSKFVVNTDGFLQNERLEKTRAAQEEFRKKASVAGKKSAEKRQLKSNERSTTVEFELQQNGNKEVNINPTLHSSSSSSSSENTVQQQHAHEVFSKKLFLDIGTLDRQNIELQLNPRRLLIPEDCEAFNRHLQTEGKHHVHWSEYIKHLRNWLNTRPTNHQKTGNSVQNNGKLNTKMTAEDLLTINQLAKDGISEDN